MRTRADEMQDDPEIRLAMLKLAADCDRLAERAEDRTKDKGAGPSSKSAQSRAT